MRRWIIVAMVMAMAAVSCQRRQFADWTTGVNLKLDIHTEIVNSGTVPMPEIMRVDLFDPSTGDLKHTDYVGPQGGYIYPPPGTYNMIIYNFGTEATIVRNERHYNKVEAYTNEVSAFLKSQIAEFLKSRAKAKASRERTKVEDDEERIVYEPDHLFVGRVESLEIPAILEEDEDREITIEVDAKSVVETWKVSLPNIEGLQWVRDAVAIMSGQVGSYFIGTDSDSDEVVSIYFELKKNEAEGTLVGQFNTFGKHPREKSELSFDINITDTAGESHHFHFDVDDHFEDNPDFHIVVEEEIVIEEPKVEGGGFAPKVEDWENVNTDIIL